MSGAAGRFVQETRALARRWAIQAMREPFSLLFALFQPLILLLFLGSSLQRMGGAITGGTGAAGAGDYRVFMMPGILALTVFGNSMAGGIPILFDRENGFLSRLLSAPITRSSLFTGRFLVVNAISSVQILIMMGLGVLLGLRVASGLAGVLGIVGLGLALGFGFTVLSLVLAFRLKGHAAFFGLLSVITLPVTFLSSAFVPLDALPGWMRAVALLNPMTWAIGGMRDLVQGGATTLSMAEAFGALGLFDLIALVIGIRELSRRLE